VTKPPRLDSVIARLSAKLIRLLNSGASTERALAAKLHISQSHLHNILSGKRKLTSAIADQILDQMDWSLLDLFQPEELTAQLEHRNPHARANMVPLSNPGAGPGVLFPGLLDEELAVPISWLTKASKPVAIAIASDPDMAPTFNGGDLLLVDRGLEVRESVSVHSSYVVQCGGDSFVRQLRESGRGLYLVTERNWIEPGKWRHWDCDPLRLPDVIQARVIARRRPPDGRFQSLPPRFAAS
jgi:hypothetical protein